jgi:hypothetical protein
MEPRIRTRPRSGDRDPVYHTDEDCRAYKQTDGSRPLRRGEKEEYDECDYCSGEYEPTSGSMETYNKAVKIGKKQSGGD